MARWAYRLYLGDVFHDESRSFEERRDEMVRRIRASRFFPLTGIADVADELADTEDEDDWDGPWSTFYDLADHHRIWVVTWEESRAAGGDS